MTRAERAIRLSEPVLPDPVEPPIPPELPVGPDPADIPIVPFPEPPGEVT